VSDDTACLCGLARSAVDRSLLRVDWS
jgi:hypothetical protein